MTSSRQQLKDVFTSIAAALCGARLSQQACGHRKVNKT
jgi:hypothetical protein